MKAIYSMIIMQGERIDDLKMIVGKCSDAATLFDHDGISVRFMNNSTEGNNIRSAQEATNLIQQVLEIQYLVHDKILNQSIIHLKALRQKRCFKRVNFT